jgi:signal transduction histidine kinase
VGLLVVGAVLEGLLRPGVPDRALTVIVAVSVMPPLLLRRTRPRLTALMVFGAMGVSSLAAGTHIPDLDVTAAALLVPFSLTRWGTAGDIAVGAAAVTGGVTAAQLVGAGGLGDLPAAFAVLSAALAIGAAFRFRAGARLRELDQAALLERERLARDLHDTVAHHVSAIAVRAQAGLATAHAHPGAATDALRVIEVEASRTLAEMRAMVHLLRHEGRTGGLGIADLARLASPSLGGPAVDVEVLGDIADVPPPVSSAIFRLAQESVTNARRHARRATRIEVRVAADDREIRLWVFDDGAADEPRPETAPGYGIPGMRERARLLGGTCEAGPSPRQGWLVTAVLPRKGAMA